MRYGAAVRLEKDIPSRWCRCIERAWGLSHQRTRRRSSELSVEGISLVVRIGRIHRYIRSRRCSLKKGRKLDRRCSAEPGTSRLHKVG